jgi:hypothetical protein
MRLARVAAGVLIGVAVLAGCSDSPAPANDTLPSAAPTSAEASQTLPPLGPPDFPMPPEARQQTPAGAEAFLRYYLNLYNTAQATMDAQYLRQFGKSCETCEGLASQIEDDAAAGYRYQGGQLTTDGLSPPVVQEEKAEIAFSITQAALSVTTSDGAPIDGLDFPLRASPACGAILNWSELTSSWVITQWDVG